MSNHQAFSDQTKTETFKYYLVLHGNIMETVCIKLEKQFARELDVAMKKHRYVTKTEFLREAIRDKLNDFEREDALRALFGSMKGKVTNAKLHEIRDRVFDSILKQD